MFDVVVTGTPSNAVSGPTAGLGGGVVRGRGVEGVELLLLDERETVVGVLPSPLAIRSA
jgi:hypothetical protein